MWLRISVMNLHRLVSAILEVKGIRRTLLTMLRQLETIASSSLTSVERHHFVQQLLLERYARLLQLSRSEKERRCLV